MGSFHPSLAKSSLSFLLLATLIPDTSHSLHLQCATQELMKFDYEDDSNWKDIVDGVDVVFSSSPDNVIEG